MKQGIKFFIIVLAVALTSCTAAGRMSTRITAEWDIEKFESRTVTGSSTVVENAGTITFRSNGRGMQSFTSAIAHGGLSSDSEFRWENTANTVSIKSPDAQYPKVWIVVNSGRSKQEWYSTDGQGNVQVMHLRKK
ncbi:MAG: hypothetical protein EA393_02825 [Bacteroidetes bacterium]|nr:MAG: hypothetical protein EA393_02825 [Bacteroidota bacterium]